MEIVPVNPELTIPMHLFSTLGEKYFTNSDKNYLKFWHFCFQSLNNSTLEINSVTNTSKEGLVKVKFSYFQN
jgi:hypothetical protein